MSNLDIVNQCFHCNSNLELPKSYKNIDLTSDGLKVCKNCQSNSSQEEIFNKAIIEYKKWWDNFSIGILNAPYNLLSKEIIIWKLQSEKYLGTVISKKIENSNKFYTKTMLYLDPYVNNVKSLFEDLDKEQPTTSNVKQIKLFVPNKIIYITKQTENRVETLKYINQMKEKLMKEYLLKTS